MPADDKRSRHQASAIGDDLLSLRVADTMTGQALAEALRKSGEWLEAVAGIDSVVVRFDNLARGTGAATERLTALLETLPETDAAPAEPIEIPVVYGGDCGPDLDEVCETLGLSVDAFVAAHTGACHQVELLGFMPGFAYLGNDSASLDVPRRAEPRQRVPAGSIGIAGGRTGLYALAGPGGWSIVGRTPMALFDPSANQPFTLTAGMRVRFRAIDADEFESRSAE